MFTARIFLIVMDVIYESSLLLYGQTFKLFVFERERESASWGVVGERERAPRLAQSQNPGLIS